MGQITLDELPPRKQRFTMRSMRFRYSISHVPGKDFVLQTETRYHKNQWWKANSDNIRAFKMSARLE